MAKMTNSSPIAGVEIKENDFFGGLEFPEVTLPSVVEGASMSITPVKGLPVGLPNMTQVATVGNTKVMAVGAPVVPEVALNPAAVMMAKAVDSAKVTDNAKINNIMNMLKKAKAATPVETLKLNSDIIESNAKKLADEIDKEILASIQEVIQEVNPLKKEVQEQLPDQGKESYQAITSEKVYSISTTTVPKIVFKDGKWITEGISNVNNYALSPKEGSYGADEELQVSPPLKTEEKEEKVYIGENKEIEFTKKEINGTKLWVFTDLKGPTTIASKLLYKALVNKLVTDNTPEDWKVATLLPLLHIALPLRDYYATLGIKEVYLTQNWEFITPSEGKTYLGTNKKWKLLNALSEQLVYIDGVVYKTNYDNLSLTKVEPLNIPMSLNNLD